MKLFCKTTSYLFIIHILLGCHSFNSKRQEPSAAINVKVVYELPITASCEDNSSKLIQKELENIFSIVTCLSSNLQTLPDYQYLLSIKHDFVPISKTKAYIQTEFRLQNNQNLFLGHIAFRNSSVETARASSVFSKHFLDFKGWIEKNEKIDTHLPPKTFKLLDAIAIGNVVVNNKLFQEIGPTIFKIQEVFDNNLVGSGTAFLIHEDGLFLTASHVVSKLFEDEFKYYTSSSYGNPYTYEADIEKRAGLEVIGIKADKWLDLALFTVKKDEEVSFEKALKIPQPQFVKGLGEEVLSIGYSQDAFPFTLTKGIVSGYLLNFGKILTQVSSDIEKGMSGGPTISAKDNTIVGINVLKDNGSTTIGWLIGVETIHSFLSEAKQSQCLDENSEWCEPLQQVLGESKY